MEVLTHKYSPSPIQQNKTLIIPLIIILGILISLIVVKMKIKRKKGMVDEGIK
ncbi:MAG: hypothetical protein GW780_05355 [Candidatus Aenigmarchaeota archaeon]|nr:hypothetical protein [Candidatus Aenigmarchaeota archaeon]